MEAPCFSGTHCGAQAAVLNFREFFLGRKVNGNEIQGELLRALLLVEELMCSVHGNGAFWDNGCVRGESMLDLHSEVRVIRPETLR